MESSAKKAF
jgi:hypothetical protein